MNNINQKQIIRRRRVRAKVSGTSQRPRLSVKISHQHVTAQLIDDTKQATLAYVSTVGAKVSGSLTAKAAWTGEQIADQAAKHKVTKVVLDRGSRLYHGRLHALAEAARAKGLEL